MIQSILLAATSTTVPHTAAWNPKVAIVMIIANIIAIAFARATVRYPNVGAQFPLPQLGLSIPAFIASTSFGHLLGAGAILGLANLGVL